MAHRNLPRPAAVYGMLGTACADHHGLAATAVHSREAGYIYATGIVITASRPLARTLDNRRAYLFRLIIR